MSTSTPAAITSSRSDLTGPIALVLLGLALSLGIGVSVGYPTPMGRSLVGLLAGAFVLGVAVARPAIALQIVAGSSLMLIVWGVGYGYTLNAYDALLPPLVLTWWLTGTRRDETAVSDERAILLAAQRRLVHAVLWYFGLAAASLGLIVFRHGLSATVDSATVLVRGFQGALLFGLGRWLFRRERDLHQVANAMLIGGLVFAVVSAFALSSGTVKRAGLIWFADEPLWSIGSPNEAATGLLVLWALILVRHVMRPRVLNLLLLAIVLVMLVLTQSRSGLLSLMIFTALCVRLTHWRPIATGAALLAVALPFVPMWYWERMARTLVLERGSFEAFSSLVRVYTWESAWRVFLDYPLFGVGFLGYRLVSVDYNSLGLSLFTAESIFLEVATGMGVVGLVALGFVIYRLYEIGRVVKRVAPPGTLAAAMARFHFPLMTAFVVCNLTGDNWVGLVCVAQTALWCAMLMVAAEISLETRGAG